MNTSPFLLHAPNDVQLPARTPTPKAVDLVSRIASDTIPPEA
jgi:hypothetical protein